MAITVTTAAGSVSILNASPRIMSRMDEQGGFAFTLVDQAGTAMFYPREWISVDDDILGNLFAGYISDSPAPSATLLYPSPTRLWVIQCIDESELLNRTSSNKRYANQFSGCIAVDQIQRYAAADGLTAAAALAWTEQLSEWQNATMLGTRATTNAASASGNAGDGDVELSLAGSNVSYNESATSDFASGTLTNVAASSNTLKLSTYNVLRLTGTCQGGGGNSFLAQKIWSGSFSISSTGYQLLYLLWISSTSPEIKAGIELVCSDGSRLSANSAIVDQYGLVASPATDLSGYANNQWYSRTIDLSALSGKTLSHVDFVLEGDQPGTYTAYVQGVSINGGGGLTIYSSGGGAPNSNAQVGNVGYITTSLSAITAYQSSGSRISNAVALDTALMAGSSVISWSADTTGGSFTLSTSLDGGATWQQATSGGAIPDLMAGMNLTGRTLKLKESFALTGSSPEISPVLSRVAVTIKSAYSASAKTDVIYTKTSTSDFLLGTLTDLQALFPGGTKGIALNGSSRAWDLANDTASQNVFGSSSPSQSTTQKRMALTSGTGTDVRSQLYGFDPGGGHVGYQNFSATVQVQIPATGGAVGLCYRTTNWGNSNDSYAYSITTTTTQLLFGKGTNSTGAGSFTSLATATVSFAAGDWHTLKVVVSGTTHQFYIDDVLYITQTDATYTAAGQLGLRFYNSTGSTATAYFRNFGVVTALTGTYQSESLSINSVGTVGNSAIWWDSVVPSDCTLLVQTSINGGSTWQTATNGGQISGLSNGVSASGVSVLVKATLTSPIASYAPKTTDASAAFALTGFTILVRGQYSASGTWSTAPMAWDTMTRTNSTGSFGTATDGQSYTKLGTGTTNLTSNEAQISNTTGDVHMRLGSKTTTDQQASCRFALSASTISGGLELRYTDANNFYRLSATTTNLSIIQMTGGVSVTLASTTIALSTGTWYWMRFQVFGAGPITLNARLWPDGTTEPSTWNLSITE